MKQVHGTFNSFKDLGAAMNIKSKEKTETRKCKNCGQPLRQVPGTNVWMCDYSVMEDQELKDGTQVQVFSKCGNVVLAS